MYGESPHNLQQQEVSGGPGLRTLSSSLPQAWVQYLIQELISHKPHVVQNFFCNSIKTLLSLGPEGQREKGDNLPRAWRQGARHRSWGRGEHALWKPGPWMKQHSGQNWKHRGDASLEAQEDDCLGLPVRLTFSTSVSLWQSTCGALEAGVRGNVCSSLQHCH